MSSSGTTAKSHAPSRGRKLPLPAAATEADADAAGPAPAPGRVHTADDIRRQADPLGGTAIAADTQRTLSRRQGQGRALDTTSLRRFGAAMKTDFSDVRIHDDAESDSVARSVQSTAFTRGSDIYFTKGRFAPGTRAGDRLLAHELTHVQQSRSGSNRDGGTVGRADAPAETAAERSADTVMRRLASTPAAAKAGDEHEDHRHDAHCSHGPSKAAAADAPIQRFPNPFKKKPVTPPNVTQTQTPPPVNPNPPPTPPPTNFDKFKDWAKEKAKWTKEKGEAANERIVDPALEANDALSDFESLASAVQTLEGSRASGDTNANDFNSFDNAGTIGGDVVSGAGIATDTLGILGGGGEFISGARKAWGGNSFDKNLGAVKMESGARRVLLGGGSMSGNIVSAAGETIPGLSAGISFANAADKTKSAVEDSVASAKLGYARKGIKHQGDKYLDEQTRVDRLKKFQQDKDALKSAKGKDWIKQRWAMKRGDLKNYDKTVKAYRAANNSQVTGALQDSEMKGFLGHIDADATWRKDFGSGSADREAYAETRRTELAKGKGQYNDFDDMHALGKVASFGQRRKGEMATMNSIGATLDVIDGAGSLSAGADFGATKASAKALKGVKTTYELTKKLVKRARRVHKLRKAKNEMGYGKAGDKAKHRSPLWGAKQFLVGNISEQMEHAKTALEDPGKNTKKSAFTYNALASQDDKDKMKWKLVKKLTLKCHRRIDDLLRCLGSDKPAIRQRARRVIKIIAETNLAGAIATLKDEDFDEYKVLYDKRKAAKVPNSTVVFSQQDGDKLDGMSSTLREIVARQLQGIGG